MGSQCTHNCLFDMCSCSYWLSFVLWPEGAWRSVVHTAVHVQDDWRTCEHTVLVQRKSGFRESDRWKWTCWWAQGVSGFIGRCIGFGTQRHVCNRAEKHVFDQTMVVDDQSIGHTSHILGHWVSHRFAQTCRIEKCLRAKWNRMCHFHSAIWQIDNLSIIFVFLKNQESASDHRTVTYKAAHRTTERR